MFFFINSEIFQAKNKGRIRNSLNAEKMLPFSYLNLGPDDREMIWFDWLQ